MLVRGEDTPLDTTSNKFKFKFYLSVVAMKYVDPQQAK